MSIVYDFRLPEPRQPSKWRRQVKNAVQAFNGRHRRRDVEALWQPFDHGRQVGICVQITNRDCVSNPPDWGTGDLDGVWAAHAERCRVAVVDEAVARNMIAACLRHMRRENGLHWSRG